MPPIPAGLDAYLPVPAANPLTRAKVELGKKLFAEKRLSADGTVSCASCHDPQWAFGDRRTLAIGVGGKRGTRRAPRLVNRGYRKAFFWDGRAQTLEQQVVQPIANPLEMASSLRDAAARAGIGESELRDALASYVRTILSGNSAFMAGDSAAMNAEEQRGLRLFTGKAEGGRANPQLDPEIRPLHLTAEEKNALPAFLGALNGTVRDGL